MLDSLREKSATVLLPAQPPIAVLDLEQGSGKVVCACDAAAAEAGITPGMALNSALALAPGLRTLSRDVRREQALLEIVAKLALELVTPRVSLEPPDAVLLEIRGSLRLLGGSRALCTKLRQELQAVGVTTRLALTPTPLASLWFARAGVEVAFRHLDELGSRLASLPLSATTRWPRRSLDLLATMGVRTIGDCLRLPRGGFARRLDSSLLTQLDQATGRRPDPRAVFRLRERFTARRELEPETASVEELGHTIAPLLEELCTFLRQRNRGVQALELRFKHREALTTRVRLRFAEPVAEPRRIFDLLRERLARLELPEPVRAIRLASGCLVESSAASSELFAMDRRASGAGLLQLVERLRARLGTEAVHGLCLVPEHRPESAWQVAEPDRKTNRPELRKRLEGDGDPDNNASRPLWLLTEPRPLAGGDEPRYEGALEFEEGPERIESGWWDGRDVTRDYYVARNPGGMRLWVFRNRPRHEDGAGSWFLHGMFG
jgi:protein ImuB